MPKTNASSNESVSAGNNLKRISIDPESFNPANRTGSGNSSKRRSRRRSSGLIALGLNGTRKTQRVDKGISGTLGMKKSEIMRKIRNGLLEKRRNAIATANKSVAPSISTSSPQRIQSQKNPRRAMLPPTNHILQKRMRESSTEESAANNSKSSTQKAIEFFELKKKETKLQNGSSGSNGSGGSNGKEKHSTTIKGMSYTLGGTMKHETSPPVSQTDINVHLPENLQAGNILSAPITMTSTSTNNKTVRSILKTSNKNNNTHIPTLTRNVQVTLDSNDNDNTNPHDKGTPSTYSTISNMEPTEIDTTDTSTLETTDLPVSNYDLDEVIKDGGNNSINLEERREMRSRRRRHARHNRTEKARARIHAKTKTRVERKKTYKLGKKGKKISVMVYGQQTRKRLGDQHRELAGGDINKLRRVLRHRCLMKTGSTAPPRLIREIYKNTRLFGDVISKCNANEANMYLNIDENNDEN